MVPFRASDRSSIVKFTKVSLQNSPLYRSLPAPFKKQNWGFLVYPVNNRGLRRAVILDIGISWVTFNSCSRVTGLPTIGTDCRPLPIWEHTQHSEWFCFLAKACIMTKWWGTVSNTEYVSGSSCAPLFSLSIFGLSVFLFNLGWDKIYFVALLY